MQHPVRVLVPHPGACVDHLRLDPQPELQAHGVEFFGKAFQAAGQLGGVHLPVAQAAVVVAAVGEPAVVQHKQLDAQGLGLGSQGQQLFFVEIKIGGLPVVDQDRTHLVPPDAPRQTGAVELVVGLGHPVEAPVAVDHHRFGGGEGLAGTQGPAEALGVDAHGHTGDVVGVHIGLGQEIAAVHQAEPIDLSGHFAAVGALEGQEGVEVVAGVPAQGVDGLHSFRQWSGSNVPFPGPGAGQLHHLVAAVRQIQTEAHSPVQPDRPLSGAGDLGVPRQGGQLLGVQVEAQVHPL